ncbi:MAG TPA: HU family DNA-binding protein [Bacteroidia bacterium]|jgi:DNA-binding protein HU-beta|nr:HU family DNA-binding protein [Bacteroidia bacterium]
MTKAELIIEIAKKTGIERVVVEATVEAFMERIKDQIAKKESVSLRGFGNFYAKKRAAKVARDINNNKAYPIPEQYVPIFKPSPKFKDKVRKAIV